MNGYQKQLADMKAAGEARKKVNRLVKNESDGFAELFGDVLNDNSYEIGITPKIDNDVDNVDNDHDNDVDNVDNGIDNDIDNNSDLTTTSTTTLTTAIRPYPKTDNDGAGSDLSQTKIDILFSLYREKNVNTGRIIINLNNHSKSYGINYGTLRTYLGELKNKDYITTKPYRASRFQGVEIFFLKKASDFMDGPIDNAIHNDVDNDKIDNNPILTTASTTALTTATLERKKRILSKEQISCHFPALFAKGLQKSKLLKIYERTDELGIEYSNVIEYLRRLDWQVANNKLTHSKTNEPIRDPFAWFLGSMIKTGYYAKPEGYKSIEDYRQEELEKERICKKISEKINEKRVFDMKFEAWKDGLLPEELEREIADFKGPREVRLRNAFKQFMKDWVDS